MDAEGALARHRYAASTRIGALADERQGCLNDFVCGKSVAITGAGGSIGSELAGRLLELGVGRLLLIDNSEIALCRQLWRFERQANVSARLGDVRDPYRIAGLFSAFHPQLVFHCAALKHVPMCEQDVDEAIKTNADGTINVAVAAAKAEAEAMLLISTDKAAGPVSALGRSKRMAEVSMARLNRASPSHGPRFAAVRFHNILGSSGSVVPRFSEQIAHGGPVTVTHPDMIRSFGTAREACDLLIACIEHMTGPDSRELYALDLGKSMRIVDLARTMIGTRDIDIVFTGIRPGERLEERLFGEGERLIEIGTTGIAGIETISEAVAA